MDEIIGMPCDHQTRAKSCARHFLLTRRSMRSPFPLILREIVGERSANLTVTEVFIRLFIFLNMQRIVEPILYVIGANGQEVKYKRIAMKDELKTMIGSFIECRYDDHAKTVRSDYIKRQEPNAGTILVDSRLVYAL